MSKPKLIGRLPANRIMYGLQDGEFLAIPTVGVIWVKRDPFAIRIAVAWLGFVVYVGLGRRLR